jgi:hypothetical protein
MLLRICLIVAIVAGIGAGVVSYLEVSDKIPALQKQRDDEKDAKNAEIAAHNKTKAELKKTQGELTQTKQELTETQGERDKAIARAEAQEKRAGQLSDKLAKTTKERDDAQNDLAAYKLTGLTPEQVVSLNKDLKQANNQIAAVNGENEVLLHNVAKLRARLNLYEGTNTYVTLPPALHGKILVVDPKWNFAVLNIGEDQGLLENGELLVSRQGRLVGKIIVRTVEKDRSIANLVPGWKLGDMIEGDEVSPAHPAS